MERRQRSRGAKGPWVWGLGLVVVVVLGCLIPSAEGQSTCTSVDCVVRGPNSYDNSVEFLTAVGCVETLTILFGTYDNTKSPRVQLLKPSQGVLLPKQPVTELDSHKQDCCTLAPLDRKELPGEECTDLENEDNPFEIFDCIEMTEVKTPGYNNVTIRFNTPYYSDISDGGTTQFCIGASHEIEGSVVGNATTEAYCITLRVQRCSVCLKDGEGLVDVAKDWGSHWTQIYSSNEDILGSPDGLDQGRLVRLGPLYQVLQYDTMMSIALKFGVSVNQLFFWNKHLRPQTDISENANGGNAMSRDLAPGDVLCILPKTCYNSFGAKQPVFLQKEVDTVHGGWWSDIPQVESPSTRR